MERVATVELNGETAAYPFSRLARAHVVNDFVGGSPLVVLHHGGTLSALDGAVIAASRDVGAAAFDRAVGGKVLTFSVRADQFADDQTGSTWDILGQATAGPLAAEGLRAVVSAKSLLVCLGSLQA